MNKTNEKQGKMSKISKVIKEPVLKSMIQNKEQLLINFK